MKPITNLFLGLAVVGLIFLGLRLGITGAGILLLLFAGSYLLFRAMQGDQSSIFDDVKPKDFDESDDDDKNNKTNLP